MSTATNYLRSKIANHVLTGVPYTPPSAVYAALFTSNRGLSGSLSDEASGGSYARPSLSFSEGDPGAMSNALTSISDMPAVTVVSLGIMDAATDGNMLYFHNFSPVTVSAGETYQIGAGALVVKHL
jgi:hypothetical protein